MFELHHGDCLEVLRTMPDNSVDSIVTDPPYELGFMGKGWDKSGIANNVELWRECLRVLKPGGHMLAFGGSRTYHRMTCAIEDAGFEVRDQIMWLYGSGFPKSLDVSKAIDKAAGAEPTSTGEFKRASIQRNGTGDAWNAGAFASHPEDTKRIEITAPTTDAARQWQGWGTALKPAHEPICVARKPLIGTVAQNVLTHGVGALNIDDCRIEGRERTDYGLANAMRSHGSAYGEPSASADFDSTKGRWPANVIHDGSDEVLDGFPVTKNGGQNATSGSEINGVVFNGDTCGLKRTATAYAGDSGSAARFFYCAKASKRDRDEGLDGMGLIGVGRTCYDPKYHEGGGKLPPRSGNHHPTVKPTDLMAYLCRLVTPSGGVVLDPFMGSGSTGKAAMRDGFRFIGIDMTAEYVDIARARIMHANDNTLVCNQSAVA